MVFIGGVHLPKPDAAALHVLLAQVVQAAFFMEVAGAMLLRHDALERDNRETLVVATRAELDAEEGRDKYGRTR